MRAFNLTGAGPSSHPSGAAGGIVPLYSSHNISRTREDALVKFGTRNHEHLAHFLTRFGVTQRSGQVSEFELNLNVIQPDP